MSKISAYNEIQSEQATEKLILDNLPLVKSIAQHIHCRLPKTILLEDLTQCGIIGLVEAARRFKTAQGVNFATFASHRIRGAIIDELRKNDELSRSAQQDAKRLQKAICLIEQSEGRAAHDAEIANALNLSMEQYEELLQILNVHYTLSLDDIDIIDDEHNENDEPESKMQHHELKQLLCEHLTHLPEKEKLVLALYYNEDVNFKQIGDILEVSESRVSQLHGQAMSRLQARIKDTIQSCMEK